MTTNPTLGGSNLGSMIELVYERMDVARLLEGWGDDLRQNTPDSHVPSLQVMKPEDDRAFERSNTEAPSTRQLGDFGVQGKASFISVGFVD
jgi:hypothetical protein